MVLEKENRKTFILLKSQPSQLPVDLLEKKILSVSRKLEGLNHMYLDHVLIGHVNKAGEF